jgi:hypothetical protein
MPDEKVLKYLEHNNKINSMAYMEAERLFKVEDAVKKIFGDIATAEDGTYVLKATVDDGAVTFAWVAEEAAEE